MYSDNEGKPSKIKTKELVIVRQMTINVYKVTELSEQAKERAYFDWLGQSDYPWADENLKTLKAFENVFPVKVLDWSYDQMTFNYRFEFTEGEDIEELTGLRLAKYIWNNYKRDILKGKFYSTAIKWVDGKAHYKNRHSNVILDDCCVLTGYYIDQDILQPVYDFLKNPSEDLNFYDLMDDCIYAWAKACKNDAQATSTMEYFEEQSEANNWEYDEAGDLVG